VPKSSQLFRVGMEPTDADIDHEQDQRQLEESCPEIVWLPGFVAVVVERVDCRQRRIQHLAASDLGDPSKQGQVCTRYLEFG